MGQDKSHSNIYPSQDPNNWKKIGFFVNDGYLLFTFKKIEKIVSALYLVTSLIKDEDPLKWIVREKAVSLLGNATLLSGAEPVDTNHTVQNIFVHSYGILTSLNVAYISNLISSMNYEVLKKEIEGVVELLKEKLSEETVRAGYVLSDSFFSTDYKVDEKSSVGSSGSSTASPMRSSAGSSTSVFTGTTDTQQKNQITHKGHFDKGHNSALTSSQNEHENKALIKDKKNDRQVLILELLKKQSNLTIKDFTTVVVGCSEKTIQRELTSLVEQGIIKKIGDRRWSRYSLA